MSNSHNNPSEEPKPAAKQDDLHTPPSCSSLPLEPTFENLIALDCNNPQHEAAQKFRPYTLVHQAILGQAIEWQHRKKLMRWLLTQTNKHNYPRGVFAFSSYYLDMYLLRRGRVSLDQLKDLGLACLFLATKIEGTPFPKLGSEHNLSSLLQTEVKLANTLNYFLYPRTYFDHLEEIMQQWDNFTQNHKTFNQVQYLIQQVPAFQNYRGLMQIAECLYITGQSLKFSDLNKLYFNLFFIHNQFSLLNIRPTTVSLQEVRRIISNGYASVAIKNNPFQNFLDYCVQKLGGHPELSQEIGLSMAAYIQLQIDQNLPSRKTVNYKMYLRTQTVSMQALRQLDVIYRT